MRAQGWGYIPKDGCPVGTPAFDSESLTSFEEVESDGRRSSASVSLAPKGAIDEEPHPNYKYRTFIP